MSMFSMFVSIGNRGAVQVLAVALLLLCVADSRSVYAQLSNDELVISEFFEEIHRFDFQSGSLTDVLDSAPGGSPFGQEIAALNQNEVVVTSFDELHRYNVANQTTELIAELSFVPSEITRDTTGNLIAVGSPGVVSIDAITGEERVIFDEIFFGPSDVVVDNTGLIYVTEFFDSLGVVDPAAGTFRQIGDFGANEFAHVDIGPDGLLYVSSTFGGEFYQVDPYSGAATLLAEESSASIVELQVASDGGLLFGGSLNSISGIFALDPTTGEFSTVIDGDQLNDGFFSVLDFDYFQTDLRATVAVPEPSAVGLLWCPILGCWLSRRRCR